MSSSPSESEKRYWFYTALVGLNRAADDLEELGADPGEVTYQCNAAVRSAYEEIYEKELPRLW